MIPNLVSGAWTTTQRDGSRDFLEPRFDWYVEDGPMANNSCSARRETHENRKGKGRETAQNRRDAAFHQVGK
ncbi:MAG: hypothetical protein AAF989_14610, partial [Planctomycetota bacterium]